MIILSNLIIHHTWQCCQYFYWSIVHNAAEWNCYLLWLNKYQPIDLSVIIILAQSISNALEYLVYIYVRFCSSFSLVFWLNARIVYIYIYINAHTPLCHKFNGVHRDTMKSAKVRHCFHFLFLYPFFPLLSCHFAYIHLKQQQ